MIKQEYKYSELTSKIIGCAMEVHKRLGNGFQEVIYQRALEIEMRLAGIAFIREFEMPIFYREEQIGTRRVDFWLKELFQLNSKQSQNWKMFTLLKPSTIWKPTILKLVCSLTLVK